MKATKLLHKSFAKSWNELMAVIASKGAALEKASVAGTNL